VNNPEEYLTIAEVAARLKLKQRPSRTRWPLVYSLKEGITSRLKA